ncbi:MAG: RNA polymerase sigma factor [bacterium]
MKAAPSDLTRRMLRGDRTSFDDVVSWYSGDILCLCYALLWDRDEAQDVLQEAMLRLVRMVKERRFRGSNGSVKGFLMTAARNCCIDRLRRKREFRSIDEDDPFTPPQLRETFTPDIAADESRFQCAFEQALSHLTDAQRTVLVLHELNGESQQAIAKSLNISVDSVKIRLCRARRKLRILLEPYRE